MDELSDAQVLAAWREAWDAAHDEGGQTTEATQFIAEDIEELYQELMRRELPIDYECPDRFCMYGCPGSGDWEAGDWEG